MYVLNEEMMTYVSGSGNASSDAVDYQKTILDDPRVRQSTKVGLVAGVLSALFSSPASGLAIGLAAFLTTMLAYGKTITIK